GTTLMGMTAVDDDRRAVEGVLKKALIGVVADRRRHFAFGIGDHAVDRDNHITFDAAHELRPVLNMHQVAKQRQQADNNDDHAHDLFSPSVDRQHINQIQDQEDDNEGNERSDKNIHANPWSG